MLRAYRYRLCPNKKQRELIHKTIGCCRKAEKQGIHIRKEDISLEPFYPEKIMYKRDILFNKNIILRRLRV